MKIFSDEQLSQIHQIGYDELRGLHDLHTKLSIVTMALTVMHDYEMFADFLYLEKDIKYWQDRINDYYQNELKSEDTFINPILNDNITNQIFNNFRNKIKEKYEFEGFFKAIYEKDDFALVVIESHKFAEKLFKN